MWYFQSHSAKTAQLGICGGSFQRPVSTKFYKNVSTEAKKLILAIKEKIFLVPILLFYI